MLRGRLCCAIVVGAFLSTIVEAAPALIATATLDRPADRSGLTDTLESAVADSAFGGIGSGLAWAGGTTFLAVPDRGRTRPVTRAAPIDNTTSFVARVHTLD